ncbi:MAG: RadC family protein [Marinomonas sp.]
MRSPKQLSSYPSHQTTNITELLEQAAEALAQKYKREGTFTNANNVKKYLTLKLGSYEREVFALMLLDSQHQLIRFEELFFGTIDAAAVYPREVVKAALHANAAAVILTHNHPSGSPEPSQSDINITNTLVSALKLIDVRVLDHIVVGEQCVSLAERGLI